MKCLNLHKPTRSRDLAFSAGLPTLRRVLKKSAVAVGLCCVSACHAFDTHLIELGQGSDLSSRVSAQQDRGFESAQGQWISFKPWYGRKGWTDSSIVWMTEINSSLGLIWGFGTGEHGNKYVISPSVKLGFLFQHSLGRGAMWSVRATHIFGGRLREKTCTADYGDIGGGEQAVNCRMAATALEPAQTLAYLFNDKPPRRALLSVQYILTY